MRQAIQSARKRLEAAGIAWNCAAIEARYAEREAVCYDKFFVNRCLDQANERRRVALHGQRRQAIGCHQRQVDARSTGQPRA